jgi:hypothetical protein
MSGASNSLNHDLCSRLKEHPSGDALQFTLGKDAAFYEGFLVQHQSRLFESNEIEFEILRLLYDSEST